MKIIFVRHGHPDYEKDCLTELGHLHATAAGKRLSGTKINRIYASTMGRAKETAEHIAKEVGIPTDEIIPFDFMREIAWDFEGPWEASVAAVRAGESILRDDWTTNGAYSKDRITEMLLKKGNDFDKFLEPLGLKRDGLYYRVIAENDNTVLIVSHAGA